jgi:hypothetical protein
MCVFIPPVILEPVSQFLCNSLRKTFDCVLCLVYTDLIHIHINAKMAALPIFVWGHLSGLPIFVVFDS